MLRFTIRLVAAIELIEKNRTWVPVKHNTCFHYFLNLMKLMFLVKLN